MNITVCRKLNLIQVMLTISFLSASIIQSCQSIMFHLQPHGKKCLKQELYTNQLAMGDYDVANLPNTQIDLTVKNTAGHVALNRENVGGKGKFAFTSDGQDFYELCFTYVLSDDEQPAPREISVNYLVGPEAKHMGEVDVDKLSEVENTLERIESLAESIIFDFAELKKRGKELHDTNDSTERRMYYQGVCSIVVLLALTCWQIIYMRTFFRAKKLID